MFVFVFFCDFNAPHGLIHNFHPRKNVSKTFTKRLMMRSTAQLLILPLHR
jgi:hypothetical protein